MERTILYIDDETINRNLFNLMFKGTYNVVLANSGEEGLSMMKENPDICLVVTDMRMPQMNGIEFVKRAKEINEEIPYFLLSGYDLTDEIHEALVSKILTGYFQKPFKKEALINVFEKHF